MTQTTNPSTERLTAEVLAEIRERQRKRLDVIRRDHAPEVTEFDRGSAAYDVHQLLADREALAADLHAEVTEHCETDSNCRELLKPWDKSDGFGVVPLEEIIAAALTSLQGRIAELEAESRELRSELSKAARLINCAGPLDHRIRVMKQDYSDQIVKLEAELQGAREQRDEWREFSEECKQGIIASHSVLDKFSVDREDAHLVELGEGGSYGIEEVSEFPVHIRIEQLVPLTLRSFRNQLITAVRAKLEHDEDCFQRTHNSLCDCPVGEIVEKVVQICGSIT